MKLRVEDESKIRKLEKEIRKLIKTPEQPSKEYQLPIPVLKELEARICVISEEDEKVQVGIEKLARIWISYKAEEERKEQVQLERMVVVVHRSESEQDSSFERSEKENYLNFRLNFSIFPPKINLWCA